MYNLTEVQELLNLSEAELSAICEGLAIDCGLGISESDLNRIAEYEPVFPLALGGSSGIQEITEVSKASGISVQSLQIAMFSIQQALERLDVEAEIRRRNEVYEENKARIELAEIQRANAELEDRFALMQETSARLKAEVQQAKNERERVQAAVEEAKARVKIDPSKLAEQLAKLTEI
jgi:uncharacterized small protein (DUF1192 family)